MLLDPALIEAPRLQFRFLTRDDAPAWEEFLSHREAVKLFPPFDDVKKFSIDWMERALNRYKNEGLGLYALIEKSSGAFVGQCGFLKQEVDGVLETEIGYHLMPRFWKNGFATEALWLAAIMLSEITWPIPSFPSLTKETNRPYGLPCAMA